MTRKIAPRPTSFGRAPDLGGHQEAACYLQFYLANVSNIDQKVGTEQAMLVPSSAHPRHLPVRGVCAPACLSEASCRHLNRSIPAARRLQSKLPHVQSA